MVFNPQNLIEKDGSFIIANEVCAKAHTCLDTNVIREFWDGFTYSSSTISTVRAKDLVFEVGKVKRDRKSVV